MSSERKPNMKDVILAIDDNAIEIDRVRNLLQLYDELIREELEILNHAEPWIKEYITRRHEVIDSVLVSASRQLYYTLSELKKIVDDFYITTREIDTAANNG